MAVDVLPTLPPTDHVPQQSTVPEHPRADEIRRQVEYYFSDANLPNDSHMLEHCGGMENKPISIKRIHGFKKMRCFKPYTQVVEALRHSAFLDVTEDGKGIKRKVPLRPWQLAGGDESDDSDFEGAEQIVDRKPEPQPVKKFEPVKSDVPNATKNLLKAHGFEDYYTEGPITPAEFKDDEALYEPGSSFSERIESAIQRFKVKKKMHQEYGKVFNKFMKYGGVEVRTQFNGMDPKELKEKDTYELTRILATHYVKEDREDPELWAVDFEGIARGFLSSQFPLYYSDYTIDEVRRATQVLRMFYNYILHHNVAPEYTKDVLAARAICDLADKELPDVRDAGRAFPGAFNVACSVLLNGLHAGFYTGDQSWALEDKDKTANPHFYDYVKWTPGQGFSQKEARIVAKAGIVAVGTDDQCEAILDGDISLLRKSKEETLGLEIIHIERATQEVLDFYKKHNQEYMHKLPMSALGKMICKPWVLQDFQPVDVSAATRAKSIKDLNRTFEFFMEDEILEDCFIGMKMEASIWDLNLGKGPWVLDSVSQVYCSFFQYHLNELVMSDRRELREPQLLPYGKAGPPESKENGAEEAPAESQAALGTVAEE